MIFGEIQTLSKSEQTKPDGTGVQTQPNGRFVVEGNSQSAKSTELQDILEARSWLSGELAEMRQELKARGVS